MFIESGRFDLWNTSMRSIDEVRPLENKFWILIKSKLFDLYNTLIRSSPWKQIEAFIGSLWSDVFNWQGASFERQNKALFGS